MKIDTSFIHFLKNILHFNQMEEIINLYNYF